MGQLLVKLQNKQQRRQKSNPNQVRVITYEKRKQWVETRGTSCFFCLVNWFLYRIFGHFCVSCLIPCMPGLISIDFVPTHRNSEK